MLDFIIANLTIITAIQQGLFAALAGICQLAGWTAASKIFGTFSTLDIGRIVRFVAAYTAAKQVTKQAADSVGPAAILLVALGVSATQPGCATLRSPSFWDTVHTGCEIAMAATPEAAAKAKAIGGTVGDVATIVCGVADVIEPFVKQEIAAKEGRRMATNATAEAVEIAKEKGLL